MTGFLIAIEGVDGAGKSTLQRALAEALRARGYCVLTSREPTAGPHGTALRQAALSERLAPERELELLLLDRRAHLQGLLLPALGRGEVVILDRYYFSTVAYQGAAGLDPDMLLAVNREFAREPELLLILDLPVSESLARIAQRGAADAFERAETLVRVRELFLSFANWRNAHVLDASLAPEQLLQAALARCEPALRAAEGLNVGKS